MKLVLLTLAQCARLEGVHPKTMMRRAKTDPAAVPRRSNREPYRFNAFKKAKRLGLTIEQLEEAIK